MNCHSVVFFMIGYQNATFDSKWRYSLRVSVWKSVKKWGGGANWREARNGKNRVFMDKREQRNRELERRLWMINNRAMTQQRKKAHVSTRYHLLISKGNDLSMNRILVISFYFPHSHRNIDLCSLTVLVSPSLFLHVSDSLIVWVS